MVRVRLSVRFKFGQPSPDVSAKIDNSACMHRKP